MKLKLFIIAVAAVLAISAVANAVPVYYTAFGVLPTDLGTLQAARNTWRTAAGGTTSVEGFESFSDGNPINFGGFTASLTNGGGFNQSTGNNLITTEGNSVLTFTTFETGSTAVDFTFGAAINFFGVDITSIDFDETHVSFLDNLGNVLNDFVVDPEFAGASFFGVINTQAFSTVRFEFTGDEFLNFDYVEYGSGSGVVPEPGTLTLLGVGLLGVARVIRRKRA